MRCHVVKSLRSNNKTNHGSLIRKWRHILVFSNVAISWLKATWVHLGEMFVLLKNVMLFCWNILHDASNILLPFQTIPFRYTVESHCTSSLKCFTFLPYIQVEILFSYDHTCLLFLCWCSACFQLWVLLPSGLYFYFPSIHYKIAFSYQFKICAALL